MNRYGLLVVSVFGIAGVLTACGAETPLPSTALDSQEGQAALAAVATPGVVAALERSNGTTEVDSEWGDQLSADQARALATPMARAGGAIANYIRETR
jgi:hypothetical protein